MVDVRKPTDRVTWNLRNNLEVNLWNFLFPLYIPDLEMKKPTTWIHQDVQTKKVPIEA